MKGYGQFCPVAKASEILCARWTPLIIRELAAGSRHFNELRRGVPLMSPSLLSRRLKELVNAGVVAQTVDAGGHPCYDLTPAGEELRPLVEQIGVWGYRWVENQFEANDLDIGLLMWDIRRGAWSSRSSAAKQPQASRNGGWCRRSATWTSATRTPGFEVDLVMRAELRALTEVWMRRCEFADAERAGRISLLGDSQLRRYVPGWFRGSPIARKGEASLQHDPT